MQDTIILGNGTSKQIKTASLPNSYAEFKAMAENGNLFADIKLNADGCEIVGTPLNKQNLLTDETAEMLGGALNIDEAFQGTQKVINGIPVDLTGIYNTQVIGYDEASGKLVPMMNVARTAPIFPSYDDPPIWTNSENFYNNCPGGIGKTSRNRTHESLKPFFISEFSKIEATISNGHTSYAKTVQTIVTLSKNSDFSTVDANFVSDVIRGTVEFDISTLTGYYFMKVEFNTTITGSPSQNVETYLTMNFTS